jgi:signal transduction histidine kinase
MPDAPLPTLLSLASHELRGPTGVARGYLRLLEQDASLPDRAQSAVAGAASALAHVGSLLDELSELARLKQGGAKLTLRVLSLRSLLAQAAQATALSPAQDVQLDVVAPVEVRIRGDEMRLRAALSTLVLALARAQSGAAIIELRVVPPRAGRRGPAQIVITPRTLGHGAAVDRAMDLTRGGLGLRLAIADVVLQAHGWRVQERWSAGRWVGFVIKGVS